MNEDVKDFLGITTGILVIIICLFTLVFGTWTLKILYDDGARTDAKISLYQNCQKQFKAGVFEEPCLTLILEDR